MKLKALRSLRRRIAADARFREALQADSASMLTDRGLGGSKVLCALLNQPSDQIVSSILEQEPPEWQGVVLKRIATT